MVPIVRFGNEIIVRGATSATTLIQRKTVADKWIFHTRPLVEDCNGATANVACRMPMLLTKFHFTIILHYLEEGISEKSWLHYSVVAIRSRRPEIFSHR